MSCLRSFKARALRRRASSSKFLAKGEKSGWRAVGLENAMAHQYEAGDVVTVFQISASNELVIEGKATIRKRVADVAEQYRVEFANKPGIL